MKIKRLEFPTIIYSMISAVSKIKI